MHFTQYRDRSWGLIQTRSHFEKITRNYVEGLGIPCYLPLVRKVRSKDRYSYLPMFRSYLFAAWNFDERGRLSVCKSIVTRIETPSGCDSEIINQMESLYKLEQLSEKVNINLQVALKLPDQQIKKVVSEPFIGFSGYWKENSGQKVFAITLDILDSQFVALVDGINLICE